LGLQTRRINQQRNNAGVVDLLKLFVLLQRYWQPLTRNVNAYINAEND
jgi:hypothetical protein